MNLTELMQFKSLKFLWSTLVGEGCLGMIGGMVVFKGRFIEWKPEDIWSKEPATTITIRNSRYSIEYVLLARHLK